MVAVAPVAAEAAAGSTARRTAAVASSPTGSVSMVAGGFGHGAATTVRVYPKALAYRNGELYVGESTSAATPYLPRVGFVRRINVATGATVIVAGGGTHWTE